MTVIRLGALPASGFRPSTSSAIRSAALTSAARAVTSTQLTRPTAAPTRKAIATGARTKAARVGYANKLGWHDQAQRDVRRVRFTPKGPTAPGEPAGFGRNRAADDAGGGAAVGSDYEYAGGDGDYGYGGGGDYGGGGGGGGYDGYGLEPASDLTTPSGGDGIPKWAAFGAIGLVLVAGVIAFNKGLF